MRKGHRHPAARVPSLDALEGRSLLSHFGGSFSPDSSTPITPAPPWAPNVAPAEFRSLDNPRGFLSPNPSDSALTVTPPPFAGRSFQDGVLRLSSTSATDPSAIANPSGLSSGHGGPGFFPYHALDLQHSDPNGLDTGGFPSGHAFDMHGDLSNLGGNLAAHALDLHPDLASLYAGHALDLHPELSATVASLQDHPLDPHGELAASALANLRDATPRDFSGAAAAAAASSSGGFVAPPALVERFFQNARAAFAARGDMAGDPSAPPPAPLGQPPAFAVVRDESQVPMTATLRGAGKIPTFAEPPATEGAAPRSIYASQTPAPSARSFAPPAAIPSDPQVPIPGEPLPDRPGRGLDPRSRISAADPRLEPTSALPGPLGADLIAELGPLEGESLDAALVRILSRYDELAAPAGGPIVGPYRILPIAGLLAAFEIARRWRASLKPDETGVARSWKARSSTLRGFF